MKYFYFFLLLIISSCVERIDFKVERQAGQIIIDGSLTNEEGIHKIRVGETAPSARIPLPIPNASVRIFDDKGKSEAYQPDPQNPGTYLLYGNEISGKVGSTYFIEVELENGSIYRSIPEQMPAQKAVMESIYYDFSQEKEVSAASIVSENTHINVYLDVDLSQVDSSLFLRWDVEEVFLLTPTDFPDPFGSVPPPCFVFVYTSDINLNLFHTTGNEVPALQGLKVASQKVGWQFREKHYFTVRQKSLNQAAYQYWEKASALLSNVGNIFDVPPAPIPGNLYNIADKEEEVLGYFAVSSSSLIRFHTFRNDIPLDQILECTYSQFKNFRDYPDYCLDCTTVRNSSFERPDFF